MCQRLPPRSRTWAERLLHALLAGLSAALQHLQPLAHGAQVAGEVGDSDLRGGRESARSFAKTRAALLKQQEKLGESGLGAALPREGSHVEQAWRLNGGPNASVCKRQRYYDRNSQRQLAAAQQDQSASP